MAKIERIYNIPLRTEWLKAPGYKRAKRAVSAVRQFLIHHMKCDTVILGNRLNEAIWARGIRSPPHHIKVTTVKSDDGTVRAELHGYPIDEPKKEKKGKLETLKEKITGKTEQHEAKVESTVATGQPQDAEKPKRTRTKKEIKPAAEETATAA